MTTRILAPQTPVTRTMALLKAAAKRTKGMEYRARFVANTPSSRWAVSDLTLIVPITQIKDVLNSVDGGKHEEENRLRVEKEKEEAKRKVDADRTWTGKVGCLRFLDMNTYVLNAIRLLRYSNILFFRFTMHSMVASIGAN